MQILSFLFEKHLDKTVTVVAAALSIFMLTRSDDSQLQAAQSIKSFLLEPIHRVETYFSTIDELEEENRDLKKLVATLYHERERLRQFETERNRLRELLGLRRDTFYDLLPCDVIARSYNPSHNFVVVDRGKNDEVEAGMAVVGYRGLVGRVSRAFPNSSNVILLSNRSVSVSCINRRSRVVGVLEWERENLFRLEYIGKEEDVQVSDTLLTSGLGMLFPRGFVVATVFQVTDERGGLSKKVRAASMTDLDKLEELFIVVGPRDWNDPYIYEKLDSSLGIEDSRGLQ
jgi:rod shape-determining protein MreC